MDGDLTMLALAGAVLVAVLWRGCRGVDDAALAWWAHRFDVALPPDAREGTARRLRRHRSQRAVAMATGLAARALPVSVAHSVAPADASRLSTPALGHAWLMAAAVGALVAEARVARTEAPAGPARAGLVRRRVADYVDPGWATAAVALGTLAVVGALAVAAGNGLADAPDRGWWWAYAAAGTIAVATIATGLRVVRDRPLATPDGAGRAVDEAFRADGAHHVVGACLALAAAGAAGVAGLTSRSALVVVPAQLGVMAALAIWGHFALDRRWSVPARRRAAA